MSSRGAERRRPRRRRTSAAGWTAVGALIGAVLVSLLARPSSGAAEARWDLVHRAWDLRTHQESRSAWGELGRDAGAALSRPLSPVWGTRLKLIALQAALETEDAAERDRLEASLPSGWPRLVAVSLASSREPAIAARWLASISAAEVPPGLRAEWRVLLAEGTAEGAVASEAWRSVLGANPSSSLVERALARLARDSNPAEAASWARRYWRAFPSGPNRTAVASLLARTGPRDEPMARELARVLLEADRAAEAERAIASFSGAESRLLRARCRARLGDVPGAIAIARELFGSPSREISGSAGIWLASWLLTQHEVDAALAVYRQVATRGGESGLRALDRWAFWHRKHDEDSPAEAVERSLIERYPASSEANECRWRMIWRAHERGRPAEALEWARAMGDAQLVKVEGPAGRYWTGRFLEEAGQASEARAAFERTIAVAPRSYYGWRARHRMGPDPGYEVPGETLRPRPIEVMAFAAPPREPASGDPLGAMPVELREAVLAGQASWAWHWATDSRHPLSDRMQGLLAWLSGRPGEAIAAGVRAEESRLAYPLAYRTQIEEAVSGTGVPAALLTALVKQESRFDPLARSWVGATGLAQLMPGTARAIASRQGIVLGPLTDPALNLWLGARYLADVQNQLGGRAVLAVAAYNAGPRPVRRWMELRGNLPVDIWVERIPYPETRHYVKKVFANLWNYRDLYR